MNTSMDDINMFEEALSYAKRGYKIFPLHTPNAEGRCSCSNLKCENIGKHPRYESGTLEHGLKDATSDENRIRHWWTKWPDANIGLITGEVANLVVLDIDNEEGYEALAKLIQTHGQIQSTYKVKTTRGEHQYFAHPLNGIKIKSISALGGFKGLDVRADGGYVVAANSLRRDGKRYSSTQSLLKDDLAPIPDWLLRLMQSNINVTLSNFDKPLDYALSDDKQNVHERLDTAAVLEGVKEGQRDDYIFRMACKLRHADVPKAIAEELVLKAAKECKPPFSSAVALEKVSNAYSRYPSGKISQFTGTNLSNSFISLSNQEALEIKWPNPPEKEAFHGPVGQMVQLIEPHTEADPVGILIELLVAFGNAIGRNAFFPIEFDRHYANLFTVLVGESSKARKGVSMRYVKTIMSHVDQTWVDGCAKSGLVSGEGIIWNVRDPIYRKEIVKKEGLPTGEVKDVVVDFGVEDKRLLAVEHEFASVLRVNSREGSILSCVLRDAWDTGDLNTMAKNNPATAKDAHISVIGHITKDELRKNLKEIEMGNGFANRFCWVCVKRARLLPEGGNLDQSYLIPLIEEMEKAKEFGKNAQKLTFNEESRSIWHAVYPELSKAKPGLLGSIIGRSESQVLRMALVYAILDRSDHIQKEHLMAALSLWNYCEQSCEYIFGFSMGDTLETIQRALKQAPNGLSKTEIHKLFNRNIKVIQINDALDTLKRKNLVKVFEKNTNGRNEERWFYVQGGTKNTN